MLGTISVVSKAAKILWYVYFYVLLPIAKTLSLWPSLLNKG